MMEMGIPPPVVTIPVCPPWNWRQTGPRGLDAAEGQGGYALQLRKTLLMASDSSHDVEQCASEAPQGAQEELPIG